MKKYLAILCTLLMLNSFVSCGDNQENSVAPSSSVSEQDTILDSKWEYGCFAIAKSSKWEEKVKIDDNGVKVDWNNSEISLFLDTKKLRWISEEEFIERYDSPLHDEYGILNIIKKNGQTYIVMGIKEDEEYIEEDVDRELIFLTTNFDGTIYYSLKDEEIVMNMIDAIEFKSKEDVTTTITTIETAVVTTEITVTETTKAIESSTEKPTTMPTTKATEPPTNPPVVQKNEKTVYYTETGSKYHYDSKCGRGNYFPCTLDEAVGMGLEPCKKCAS